MIDIINIMYGVGDIERDGEDTLTGENIVVVGVSGGNVDGVDDIIGRKDGDGKDTNIIIDAIVMLEYFQWIYLVIIYLVIQLHQEDKD